MLYFMNFGGLLCVFIYILYHIYTYSERGGKRAIIGCIGQLQDFVIQTMAKDEIGQDLILAKSLLNQNSFDTNFPEHKLDNETEIIFIYRE